MQEFLVTRKNLSGNTYGEIVFFRDEDTAWRWVESMRDSKRPALFVEELSLDARWTGIHASD